MDFVINVYSGISKCIERNTCPGTRICFSIFCCSSFFIAIILFFLYLYLRFVNRPIDFEFEDHVIKVDHPENLFLMMNENNSTSTAMIFYYTAWGSESKLGLEIFNKLVSYHYKEEKKDQMEFYGFNCGSFFLSCLTMGIESFPSFEISLKSENNQDSRSVHRINKRSNPSFEWTFENLLFWSTTMTMQKKQRVFKLPKFEDFRSFLNNFSLNRERRNENKIILFYVHFNNEVENKETSTSFLNEMNLKLKELKDYYQDVFVVEYRTKTMYDLDLILLKLSTNSNLHHTFSSSSSSSPEEEKDYSSFLCIYRSLPSRNYKKRIPSPDEIIILPSSSSSSETNYYSPETLLEYSYTQHILGIHTFSNLQKLFLFSGIDNASKTSIVLRLFELTSRHKRLGLGVSKKQNRLVFVNLYMNDVLKNSFSREETTSFSRFIDSNFPEDENLVRGDVIFALNTGTSKIYRFSFLPNSSSVDKHQRLIHRFFDWVDGLLSEDGEKSMVGNLNLKFLKKQHFHENKDEEKNNFKEIL